MWIPAWMIVREHDTNTRIFNDIGNNLPDRKLDGAFIAAVARRMNAAQFLVDVRDHKPFVRTIKLADVSAEELYCTRRSLERYYSLRVNFVGILSLVEFLGLELASAKLDFHCWAVLRNAYTG